MRVRVRVNSQGEIESKNVRGSEDVSESESESKSESMRTSRLSIRNSLSLSAYHVLVMAAVGVANGRGRQARTLPEVQLVPATHEVFQPDGRRRRPESGHPGACTREKGQCTA